MLGWVENTLLPAMGVGCCAAARLHPRGCSLLCFLVASVASAGRPVNSATEQKRLLGSSVAVQQASKPAGQTVKARDAATEATQLPVYEDTCVCTCASYIEGFSRFSRWLQGSGLLTSRFRRPTQASYPAPSR